MTLHITRTTETARLPVRAHPGDAGLDLYADEKVEIPAFGRALVSTGLKMAIDPGKIGLILPCLDLATRYLSNDAGVVKSSCRKTIRVLVTNGSKYRHTVMPGDKIAQLLIQPVYSDTIVDCAELSEGERGEFGFGSSGNGV